MGENYLFSVIYPKPLVPLVVMINFISTLNVSLVDRFQHYSRTVALLYIFCLINIHVHNCVVIFLYGIALRTPFDKIQRKGNESTQTSRNHRNKNHTIPHDTQKYLNRSDGVKRYPKVRQHPSPMQYLLTIFKTTSDFFYQQTNSWKTRAAI